MSLEDRRSALVARRDEIMSELLKIEDQLDDPADKDWEEAAIEAQDDEVLESLGQAGKAELRRSEAALERIEQDEYGICVKCGAEIEERRLDLLPDTPFCAQCA